MHQPSNKVGVPSRPGTLHPLGWTSRSHRTPLCRSLSAALSAPWCRRAAQGSHPWACWCQPAFGCQGTSKVCFDVLDVILESPLQLKFLLYESATQFNRFLCHSARHGSQHLLSLSMSGEMLSWKMLTVPIAEFMKLLELLASSPWRDDSTDCITVYMCEGDTLPPCHCRPDHGYP